MAKTTEYKIVVDMALKGAKSIENKFKEMFHSADYLKQTIVDGMGFKELSPMIDKFSTDAKNSFAILNQAVKDYVEATKTASSGESIKATKDQEAAAQNLVDIYQKMIPVLSRAKITYNSIEQVAKSSFASQERQAHEYLMALEQLGVNIDLFREKFRAVSAESKNLNTVGPLSKFNKELEFRANKLKEIESIERRIGSAKNITPEMGNLLSELSNVKEELLSASTSTDTIRVKLSNLKLNSKTLESVTKLDSGFRHTIKALQELNADKKVLSDLTKQFDLLYQSAVRSGDTTALREFNADLEKRKNLLANIATYQEKIANSVLPKPNKNQLQSKLSKQSAGVLDTGVDFSISKTQTKGVTQEITKAISEADKFKTKMEKVVSSLTIYRRELDKELKSLTETLALKEKYLTTSEVSQIKNTISELQKVKGELDSTIKSASSKKVFDSKSTQKYFDFKNQLDISKPNLNNMIKDSRIKLKISGDFSDIRNEAKKLEVEITKLMGSIDLPPQAQTNLVHILNTLKNAQSTAEKGGREELSTYKKITGEMVKRVDTFKTLSAESANLQHSLAAVVGEEAKAKAISEGIVNELKQASVVSLDVSKSISEANIKRDKALSTSKQMLTALKEREALQKNLKKMQDRYKAQLSELQRTINSKTKFATKDALNEAIKAAKELESEIQRIGLLMNRAGNLNITNKGNGVSLEGLPETKAQINAINNEMIETSLRIKDVKAQLATTDLRKWATNIAQRAVMYAGLYAGIYNVVNALRAGVTAVVEFDTNMRTIQAVFDTTSRYSKILSQDLINLSKAWGGEVTAIREAALALGRAGIETNKVVDATEIVIKMAKLTGDSIATSASAVITFQQVFGDTHPVLKELGDQLAYVANQSRLSTQDIGTFSNYALAAAKNAGLSMEAINGMAVAFSNAGVNASTIGTQIRRFSSLMRDNSTAAKEFFKKLGTTQEAFSTSMQKGKKSADEAMTWMVKKLRDLSGTEFQEVIRGMDLLASNSIALLRNNADEFLRHFQNLNAGVSGEIDKANVISEGYAAQFEKMKTAASSAFIAISQSAAPVINELVKKLTGFFKYVEEKAPVIIKYFENLFDTAMIIAFTGSMIKLSSALKLVKLESGAIALGETAASLFSLSKGGTAAAGAFAALRASVAAATIEIRAFLLTNPAGWFILAASGVAAYMYATDDATESLQKFKNAQQDGLSSQINSNLERQQKIRERLATIYDSLTSKSTSNKEALQKEAAALELESSKIDRTNKGLKEKISLLEDVNKLNVLKDKIAIVKIKYENAENPEELVSLQNQLNRMSQEAIKLQVKIETKKATTDLKSTIKSYHTLSDSLKFTPNFSDKTKAIIQARLEEYKKVITDAGLGEALVNPDKANTAFDNMTENLKLKLALTQKALSDVEIKVKAGKLDPQVQVELQNEVQKLQDDIANKGIDAVHLLSKNALDNTVKLGNAIKKQIEAGFDVTDTIDLFNQHVITQTETLVSSTKAQFDTLSQAVSESLPQEVNPTVIDSLNNIKAAMLGIKESSSAEEAAQQFSLLEIKARETLAIFQNVGLPTQDIENLVKLLSESTQSMQTLAGSWGDVNSKITKSFGDWESKLKKQDEEYNSIFKKSYDINLNAQEFSNLVLGGVDATLALKNTHISVEQEQKLIKDLQIQMQQEQIKLNKLVAQMEYISKADGMSSEQKLKILEWYNKQINEHFTKRDNMLKNTKKLQSDIATKTHKSATSASKHADEIERANRSLDKMESKYKKILGDIKGYTQDSISAEFSKIDELAKKAERTPEEVSKIKSEYLQGLYKQNSDNLFNMRGKDIGLEWNTAYQNYSEQLTRYEEFMQEKQVIEEQYSQLKNSVDIGTATQTEVEKYNQMLAVYKNYKDRQIEMDQIYIEAQMKIAAAGVGEFSGYLETMYNNGLIQGKKWLAAIQAMRVAQAIMNTYVSASEAMSTYPPPLNFAMAAMSIARGMAIVSTIKAQKYHTGGYVDKPNSDGMGGLKDNEITAILQKGEYVLTKSEVTQLKSASRATVPVTTDTTEAKDNKSYRNDMTEIAQALKPELVVINQVDSTVMEQWATSREGREVIRNIIS